MQPEDDVQRNLDVLRNVEFSVVQVYRADRSLLGLEVKDAVDALVRHYCLEEEQRTPPARQLGDRAERVFRSVQRVCEWRLGRSLLPGSTAAPSFATNEIAVNWNAPLVFLMAGVLR
jgi:hypothetical protein